MYSMELLVIAKNDLIFKKLNNKPVKKRVELTWHLTYKL